ncbi:MAG: 23S rRNA pseudouridine(1911/1915/1917) synthase RluD [Halothiobacillaceae bacterium]|nr:MAG: 23S rRNA pseudouridine(1911/1915/1917) synthase RluD [Halothiobacillaceae bacterium]
MNELSTEFDDTLDADEADPNRAVLSSEQYGMRLDQAIAQVFPDYSRSRLTAWLKEGKILVNGQAGVSQRTPVEGGERIELLVEPETQTEALPEGIPLDVVHADEHIIVINKPAGLVVHPGAGNWTGTLMNALLFHFPELRLLPRAGIVHRLDKDTSGLLVVARSLPAHKALVEALADRDMHREYMAVAQGLLVAGGTVDKPIGRHPRERTRMAVTETGREAITHYRVAEKFRQHTLLRVQLETGRTHQIRVHMAHIKLPLAGDPDYGGRLRLPKGASPELVELLRGFNRQALHAARLELEHPATGEPMAWEAPIPADMQALIELLREDHRLNPDRD